LSHSLPKRSTLPTESAWAGWTVLIGLRANL
jgi:hypothetical protein